MPAEQTYANHRRLVPGFHGIAFLCVAVYLGHAVWQAVKYPANTTIMPLILAIGVLLIFWYTRSFVLTVQDRGNAYVLRRRIEAIHWEEALAQIQQTPALRILNESIGLEGLILDTVRQANELLTSQLDNTQTASADLLSWHVSWNFELNEPRLFIDYSGSQLASIWIV